tara:strand:+ start:17 stop:319 length:303 start_codon:yes stop_codon:yes gene_type:complete
MSFVVELAVKHRNGLLPMKQYMVIERFKPDCVEAVYERLSRKGRMLPPELHFVNSWVNKELGLCYQLMETEDSQLFSVWTQHWNDLIEFDIVPVDGSSQS